MKLKEITEKYGLTPEGIDYALTQYQIVICEITRGMLSKLSYDAKDIIRIAQERWCDTCDLKIQKPMRTVTSEVRYKDHLRHCPSCGKALPNSGKYGKSSYCYKCSACGNVWSIAAMAMHYCPNCGAEMEMNYEQNCDTNVSTND